MQELIEALDSHVALEGVEVEIRLPGGSWDDVRPMVVPFSEAWTKIGDLCNTLALDEDDILHGTPLGAAAEGKSALAHEILRMMATAEHAVQGRNQ